MKKSALFAIAFFAALYGTEASARHFGHCRTPGCAFDRMFAEFATFDGNYYSAGSKFSSTEKEYVLTYNLAGVDQKHIKLTYLDRVLTLKAGDDGNTDNTQYNSVFNHSTRLPGDADENTITADYKDGLLTVKIKRDPKKAERAARTIEINKR